MTDNDDRYSWAQWIATYGPDQFYDAFMRRAQDAESTCRHCGDPIYLDIREGGGVPDWRGDDGFYGCAESPDATGTGTEDDPRDCGDHEPRRKTS